MRGVVPILLLLVGSPAAAQSAAAFSAGGTVPWTIVPELGTDPVLNGLQLQRQVDRLYRDAVRLERTDGGTLTSAHVAGLLARREALIREAQGIAKARAETPPIGSRIPRAMATAWQDRPDRP